MRGKTNRWYARLGALILSLSLAAAPASAASAVGVIIGGTDAAVTMTVPTTGDAEIGAAITVSKAGVTIENLNSYDTSAVCIGGAVYLLSEGMLLRLPAGAEAFECVAQYEESYSYYSREEIAALNAEEYARAEKTPTMLFSDGDVLYGLSAATGAYGPVGADGFIEKQITLDWENMYTEYGVRDMQNAQLLNGAIYALLTPLDASGGYSSDDMRVTRFDLTTGEARELGLAGEYYLTGYKDGLLLAYAPYGGEDAGVQAYDPETDTLGETVVPFTGYDEEMTAGISYNGGGIVYDAAADAVYFVQNSMILSYRDGTLTEIAYIPVDYASNLQTAALSDAYYFCVSWDSVYLRSLRAEDQPERTLRISGGYADEVTRAYTAETDTPIIFDDRWYSSAEAVKSDVLSGSTQNDIYVLDLQSGARALMEKGYLQPLDDSQALTEDVARMYPQIQEALSRDGQLYAYPQSFTMSLWSVNPSLWTLLELGDYPTTFMEYVDFMNTWSAEYAEENPDYTVTSLYNGKQELMLQALVHYIYHYESPDEPLSFDTPVFRETMAAIEAMDIETPDWENMTNEEMEELWEQLSRPELVSMDCDATVSQVWTYYSTPDGNYEKAEIQAIAPPVFEEGAEPVAPASLSVFVVNPESENIDLALDFLEYYAANADAELRYALHPDLTEPVRQEYYEENLQYYEEWMAETETLLAEAAEDEKQSYQETIDWLRAEMAELKETSWYISEESLANYRELAQYMTIPTDSLFFSGDGAALEVLDDVFSRYFDGQISLDTCIRELDQKVRMIYLESR